MVVFKSLLSLFESLVFLPWVVVGEVGVGCGLGCGRGGGCSCGSCGGGRGGGGGRGCFLLREMNGHLNVTQTLLYM